MILETEEQQLQPFPLYLAEWKLPKTWLYPEKNENKLILWETKQPKRQEEYKVKKEVQDLWVSNNKNFGVSYRIYVGYHICKIIQSQFLPTPIPKILQEKHRLSIVTLQKQNMILETVRTFLIKLSCNINTVSGY